MIDKAQAPGAVARTWLIDHIAYPAVGFAILIGLWAIGGWFLENNPATSSFMKFGLVPTMQAVPGLVSSGYVTEHVIASGYRGARKTIISVNASNIAMLIKIKATHSLFSASSPESCRPSTPYAIRTA